MKFLAKLILSYLGNIAALLVAAYFVAGFSVDKSARGVMLAALVFVLINSFIGPLLKLILTPIIILTLGLGIIIANAVILYVVDYFSPYITIDGFLPLLYATLIISVVNTLIRFFIKKNLRKKND